MYPLSSKTSKVLTAEESDRTMDSLLRMLVAAKAFQSLLLE